MKAYLVVLAILVGPLALVPSRASAQVVTRVDSIAHPDAASGSDIFFFSANACFQDPPRGRLCGPDVLVGPTFFGQIFFFVPVDQDYNVFIMVTDIEGAVQTSSNGTFPLARGNHVFGAGFAAAPGYYKILAIVSGANDQITFSNASTFRVLEMLPR